MALETMALDYVRHLQAKLIDDDRQIYDQFSGTLIQFIHGDIQPSIAVATVQKLLHNHPDLLRAFERFTPSNHSAAAAAFTALAAKHSDSDLKATLDLLHRIRTCLDDGVVYRKFLECVKSHNRREITLSELYCEVSRLLRNHPDLMVDFRCYLPDHFIKSQSFDRKRKRDDHGERSSPEPPPTKKERSIRKKEELVDFDMETELFEIEVKISNLTATNEAAVELKDRLSDGSVSPADFRLDKHFTPLNLACIRRIYKNIRLLDRAVNPLCAMEELNQLINKLTTKKEALEKSRLRIVQRWNKIRQSRRNV